MTNLTDLLPAGAGGKQVSFTASGSVSAGKPVNLNSNGTVSEISGTSVGSFTAFSTTSGLDGYPAAAYDANAGKIVQMWRDSALSYVGRASVGTVSGTSISYGTAATFSGSNRLEQNMNCIYDPDSQKVIFVYSDIDNSFYPTAVVGTVSGTSISFGTPVVIESNAATWSTNTRRPALTYDTNSNKVVLIYYNNSGQGSAIVGTVSGTSTSWGSRTNFFTAPIASISATFDSSTNKVICAHADAGSNLGYVWRGTVSGTSITMADQTQFLSALPRWTDIQYVSSLQKSILVYCDNGNSSRGTAVILDTSSGVSVGTSSAYASAGTSEYNEVVFDTNTSKAIITYRDSGNSDKGTVVEATISGNTVSFTSPVVWSPSAAVDEPFSVYDSTNSLVYVCFNDANNSSRGSGALITPGTFSASAFLGIADAAISDTASGNITIKGGVASNGLSSLTVGSTYYVQSDGTLSTTSSSVTAGKALSATSINLDYSS
jgi:hypothetical protein